jgi:hypothetical protein
MFKAFALHLVFPGICYSGLGYSTIVNIGRQLANKQPGLTCWWTLLSECLFLDFIGAARVRDMSSHSSITSTYNSSDE